MTSRYARQTVYPYIGKIGQKKLATSKVVVIGVGGIGTQTSNLLTRVGIGNLTLIDKDKLELNNLQRQSLFQESDINKYKVLQAKKHLKKINSKVKITTHKVKITEKNISKLIPTNTTLILDCTDNMEARKIINNYAISNNIPWIYTAAIRSTIHLLNIIPKKTPCLECLFSKPTTAEKCVTAGILNTTTSLAATLQVSEAIKIILNKNYSKDLLVIDLEKNKFDKIKVKRNCSICS
jgi:molybdopterin-synthase adenylyltransferase